MDERFSVRSTPEPSAITCPLMLSTPLRLTVPQPLNTPLLSVTNPVCVGIRTTAEAVCDAPPRPASKTRLEVIVNPDEELVALVVTAGGK